MKPGPNRIRVHAGDVTPEIEIGARDEFAGLFLFLLVAPPDLLHLQVNEIGGERLATVCNQSVVISST